LSPVCLLLLLFATTSIEQKVKLLSELDLQHLLYDWNSGAHSSPSENHTVLQSGSIMSKNSWSLIGTWSSSF